MVAARVPPPEEAPPRYLQTRWIDQRLWIGPFLVPDRPFLVHPPCRVCRGAVFYEDGSFRCLHCSREHAVLAIRSDGRILQLGVATQSSVRTVRELPFRHRNLRAASRRAGATGFAARVLKLVPSAPAAHAVVEELATRLGARRDQVRSALDQLAELGLVEPFSYAGGYRQGWRRPAMSTEDS
jgi:hypothetical protein